MIFAFLVLAVSITGCTTPVILNQRVVETEKIVLKDAAGKVRMQIAVDEGGGIVQTFLDAKGTERLKLMVDAENVVRQRFLDEKGTIRLGNAVYPTDSPGAPGGASVTAWRNKAGQELIRIHIDEQGVARHTLHDEKGTARVGSYVYPGDHPTAAGVVGVDIMQKNGTTALTSYIDTDRVVRHVLFDEKMARVNSYVNPADHPKRAGQAGSEWTNSSNNGAWIRMRTVAGGDAYHEFMDSDNKERIALNLFKDGLADQRFSDQTGTLRSQTYTKGKDVSFNLFDTTNKLRFNTTSFHNGTVVQSFLGETGENKASTTVASDGTVTHYLEKGAFEKIWDNRALILMGVDLLRRFNSDK